MPGNYRFSWLKPGGWTRLGVAGGTATVFLTPMLWALGGFGDGADAVRRAVVFLMAGLWFFIALGYLVGWSIRGFVVRVKGEGEDDDGDAPPARPAGHGPGPASAPHRH